MFQFNLLITICVVHINNSLIFMLLCRFIIIIIFFTVYNPIIDCKLSHIVWQYAQSKKILMIDWKLMFKAFSQLRLKTCLFKETVYQKQTCKKLFGCLRRKYYFSFLLFFLLQNITFHWLCYLLLAISEWKCYQFFISAPWEIFTGVKSVTIRSIPRGASHVVRLSSDDR